MTYQKKIIHFNFMDQVLQNVKNTLKRDWLSEDLYEVMKKTREEPGLSLRSTAQIIKSALAPEEIKSLIKELN